MMKKVTAPLLAALLMAALSVPALADTIRLKDGSVIQGQVVGFKDQQFTVLIGTGSRGRRSRVLLYAEDVESIEFDGQAGTQSTFGNDDNNNTVSTQPPVTQPSRPNTSQPRPTTQPTTRPDDDDNTTQPTSRPSNNQGAPTFFQINTRVRGDNTTNGWTNSGLVVRQGQRLRISATGRVMLGAGRASTPAGLPTLADRDKLMRNEPTGALIAVIGDNNDDFILIGRSREFVAQRDGVLFLGVNEGNLNDNTGTYEVTIEAEAR
ncbi:MAG TPA: hypothetical protein VF528_09855 [Pyrinomonadaceae bacterium]|jgi:hypothetical protein